MTTDDQLAGAALLPCPFCGETARVIHRSLGSYVATVECVKCDVGVSASLRSEAIAAWNRRASDKREGEGDVVDALERALWCLDHADWKNGNTDPSGSIDEGEVLMGREVHRLKEILKRSKESQPKPAGEAGGWDVEKLAEALHGWSTNESRGWKHADVRDDYRLYASRVISEMTKPIPPPEPKTGEGG